jgi:hypothetical protein
VIVLLHGRATGGETARSAGILIAHAGAKFTDENGNSTHRNCEATGAGATLLRNGSVLVIGGGSDGSADPPASAEVWSSVP